MQLATTIRTVAWPPARNPKTGFFIRLARVFHWGGAAAVVAAIFTLAGFALLDAKEAGTAAAFLAMALAWYLLFRAALYVVANE